MIVTGSKIIEDGGLVLKPINTQEKSSIFATSRAQSSIVTLNAKNNLNKKLILILQPPSNLPSKKDWCFTE